MALEYAAELFDATTMRRLLAHFETLLRDVATEPGRRISELKLLTAAEEAQLSVEWNDTAQDRQPACLHELVTAQARRTPGSTALVCGRTGERLTYRQLERRSAAVAAMLRELGVGAEVRVGVCLPRTPELVVALLGVLRAGAAYVPIDPAYPAERRAFMLSDSGARVLISDSDPLPRRAPAGATQGVRVGPENLSHLIYTSGSTGRPKGVAIRHAAAVAMVRWSLGRYSPEELRGVLLSTSICFDISVFEIFVPLACGGAVIVAEDALALPELAARDQVTLMNTVPSAMTALVRQRALPASVRTVNLAGEPLRRELADGVYEIGTVERLYNLYGPSEDTTYTTWSLVPRYGKVTVGRPLAGTRAFVLGRAGRPVPIGVPGELYVGGDGLARGYLGRPALTAERFGPDPRGYGARLYRTGDLVRYLPGGEIDFLGRVDHQVKVRGFRIELGEIESALLGHKTVRECVVTVHEDAARGSVLVAYVAGEEPRQKGLQEYLRERLPDVMVPPAFVVLEKLPLLPNGKVNRKALPAPDWADAGGAQIAPRGPVEELLAGIFCEVLGVGSVGVRDDFFALGGHSLLATQVMSRVRRLGTELPVKTLFEARTVAGLAERIAREKGRRPLPPIPRIPREEDGDLVLSFAQERLWFLDQLESGSAFYNIPLVFRVTGPLRVEVLQAVVEHIVRRHESLRTTFGDKNGVAVQRIAESMDVSVPVRDLSGLPGEARRAEARRQATAEIRRPFDLARGPLVRVTLLRLGEAEHLLTLTTHHIVFDGWSAQVWIGEMVHLYEELAAGRAAALKPLAVQYADFAAWQRATLRGEALEEQMAFWREKLSGVSGLELPTDRPRPRVERFRGTHFETALSRELTAGVHGLARREESSLFMVLLAAFFALLRRYSGQDPTVGTPVANRNREEVEGVMGFFANTLVLRAGMKGATSFREFLAQVRETCLEAYAHQDLPFEKLVEEVQPERDMSRNPLFQVMLVLENQPGSKQSFSDLTMELVQMDPGTAKFDLTLFWWEEEPGRLDGLLEYNTDLFDGTTTRRFLEHYLRILETVVDDVGVRWDELPLLSPAARHQLSLEWNDTRTPGLGGRLVHRWVEEQAALTPEEVAILDGDRRMTYRELNARANQLAWKLRRLGVGPERLVGICIERSIEMVAGFLAVLKAGGAGVALDPSYPKDRIAYVIQNAEMTVLLTQEAFLESLPEHGGTNLLLDEGWEELAGEPTENPDVDVESMNPVYAIYTSGSTGLPKGIVVTHGAFANLVDWQLSCSTLARRARTVQFAAFGFCVSFQEMFTSWCSGGSLVMADEMTRRDVDGLAAFLEAQEVERLHLPFAALKHLAEVASGHDVLPSQLKEVITAGEQLQVNPSVRALFGRLPGCSLHNQYGASETHVVSAHTLPGTPDRWTAIPPAGRPVANVRIYLLDSHLRPVPMGVTGALWTAGACDARGYLKDPRMTAEKFVPDPLSGVPGGRLYRTGDLARYLRRGEIEYFGRGDDQVKIRGFRVELGEVETRLAQSPLVRDAAVLARGGSPAGPRLAAYVVPAESGGDEAELEGRLREALSAVLPEYMLPSAFVFLDVLPLNTNGKLDREALPEPDWGSAQVAYVEPRTATERKLAEIWAEVLQAGRVGAEDDFFALGGHSLLATQVVSRLRQAFHTDLPLRELFAAPTLAALAAKVDALGGGVEEAIVPVPRDRALPLSFAQERLWFLDQLDPGGSHYNVCGAVRLRGRLAVGLLHGSLNAVVDRHEALRTTFTEGRDGDDRPVQVVAERLRLALPYVDLTALPEAARRAEARRLAAREGRHGFDLRRGPLLRFLLLGLEGATAQAPEHLLVLNMHHVVTDGWSLGVFVRELATLCAGRPLLPLPVQYADFAVWQRQRLGGGALEPELAWWREALRGAPGALELPTDRPRPRQQSLRGATVELVLPAPLSRGLEELARHQSVTPFMVLLAALDVLLHRMSGARDLLVGSPVAHRNHRQVEELVGFFVNTLVLRARVRPTVRFDELLAQVREMTLSAYDHQELPFEKLVEELAPERDLSRSPLFQVMLAYQNAPLRLALPDLELELVEVDQASALFDLLLNLWEPSPQSQGATSGFLLYCRDLFDATTVRRLGGCFTQLLESVVADPRRAVSELSLLGAGERHQVLTEWNTGVAFGTELRPVHEEIARRAALRSGAVAVAAPGRRLTYGELDERSTGLAHRLRERGVGRGVRVGLCLDGSPDYMVALLAVLKAGGAYVPIDPNYPEERLSYLLRDAGISVLVTGDGRGVPGSSATYVMAADGAAADGAAADALPSAELGDPVYVIYTSGSTGVPKGSGVFHRGLSNLVRWYADEYAITDRDRFLIVSSVSFDLTQKNLLTPLVVGGEVHFPEAGPFDPEPIRRTLRAEGITVVNCTPTALYAILEGGEDDAELSTLRLALLGGETISVERLLRRSRPSGFHAEVINMYGPTECTDISAACSLHPLRRFLGAPVPIGRPPADVALYVLDTTARLSPPGAPGDLWVGGASVGMGYLNDPRRTAERFCPDAFSAVAGARVYRTGDRGRHLRDGAVEFLGRLDFQVKVRGFRVELDEIQNVLEQHPAVRAAVVLVRQEETAQRLVAYVVSTAEPAELAEHLRRKVPEYMVPSAFVPLDAIPTSAHGKVDRQALERLEVPEMAGEYVAPGTPTEELLAAAFAELLGVSRVGAADDFFTLGGHSLLATQLLSRLRRTLRVELPLRTLFEASTVAELARRVEELGRGEGFAAPPPIRRQAGGRQHPLSFAQERLWFLHEFDPGNTAYNLPFVLRLRGRLDPGVLLGGLTAIVRRHESLRTTFQRSGDRPVQVVAAADAAAPRLPLVDLSGLAEEARERETRRLARAEADRPFDLVRGPLLRVHLLRLDAAAEHVLLVTLHHVVADGWSVGIFTHELSALYKAFAAGEASPLPPLPIQYPDFARWQREWLTGAGLEQQVGYWRRQLAGAPPALELPADRPRPPVWSFRGALRHFRLSAETSQAVRALCRRETVTPFMVLFAAYQVLCYRYTGQEDVVTGAGIANRNRAETEPLIGFFVNTLVLRSDLAGNPTFGELLGRVREVAMAAYAHQDLPFEKVVEELRPSRDLSRNPLVQVAFVFQNAPLPPLDLPGLRLSVLEAELSAAKFDLLLSLSDTEPEIEVLAEYSTDLFDATTIERLFADYQELLTAFTADSATRLRSVPLFRAEMARQLGVPSERLEGVFPLTATQQDLYLDAQLYPESTVYSLGVSVALGSGVDPERWAEAVRRVSAAEPLTRVRFLSYRGEPHQVVDAGVEPVCELVELPSSAAADFAEFLERRVKVPYDLGEGGLVRHFLVRDREGYRAVLAMPHVVCDAFSGRLFFERVGAVYQALATGEPEPQAGPTFFDAVGEILARFDSAETEAFWRERLRQVAAVEVPVEAGRRGAVRESFQLAGETLARIREHCAGEGLSVAAWLRALYAAVLRRCLEPAGDLLLYDVVAGRPQGHRETVGCFYHVLPVVVEKDLPRSAATADGLARRIRDERRGLGERGSVSVSMQRRLLPGEKLRFYYNYYNFAVVDLPLGRSILKVHDSFPEDEVHLLVSDDGDELELALCYDAGGFAALELPRRLAAFARQALDGTALGDLEVLAAGERQQVLVEWNDTAVSWDAVPQTLPALIVAQARRSPEAPAVVFEDETLSYRELDERSNRLARHLRRLGVGPEVVVGVAMERSTELMVSLLAVLKAGGAYLPLDPDYPSERLAFMLADASGGTAPLVLSHGTVRLDHPGRTLYVDAEWDTIAGESAAAPDGGPDGDHLAYVIYTSGSTGRPKGAMNTHRAIVNRLLWMQDAYRLSAGDRVLQKTPISFDVSVWELFWPLLTGAPLVLARPGGHRDGEYLVRCIRGQGITTLHFVPSMLRIFLEEREADTCDSLRTVIASGEALPAAVKERFYARLPGAVLHNLYGPTEAAVDVTFERCVPGQGATSVPIGRPIANLRLHVLSRSWEPVPAAVAGELLIAGVGLARGYLGRPALTAEKFVPDPLATAAGGRLYRTGDLARRRPDGRIDFLGRIDHQVKVRGFRIELGEVEAVLGGHPGLVHACVAVREDEPGERTLVAYVVAGEGAEKPTALELRRFLRRSLPEHMVPSAFVGLDALPLLPNGKVDRRSLPAPERSRPEPEMAYATPATELAARLREIWCQVLQVEQVGIHDNFFDLGGHSLLLVRLRDRLREDFAREVTLPDLFRHPTVDSLAAFLGGRTVADAAPAVARTARGGARERFDVAVVGMAGRFPGAPGVEELWHELREGRELISSFTPEELVAAGIDEELVAQPGYVRAKAALEDVDLFDAGFFGFTPREAETMDPQHRLFLECAWEALESAGVDPSRFGGRIGVFAGQSLSGYLMLNLGSRPDVVRSVGTFQLVLNNDKDYLATRVSYKLGLEGPSVNLQTACSTSLVAVHLACRSLYDDECEMALAGGVSVTVPGRAGYAYQPGGILSPDGHCRPFSAAAEGTVPGNGLGIVVLRRLEDALAAGDTVHAVVRGSAINNDGSLKMGFTAPRADGQCQVIGEAVARAGVDPSTITYVETHGTGTPLGDPIEIEALTRGLRRDTSSANGSCALGSVKSNLGHLDAAAGVTGLIKTVLALKHREIPPSLHCDETNPAIDFAGGPFYVNTRLRPWETNGGPRRAAVSSFGIGGTNAHVVLEEAPPAVEAAPAEDARPWHLLALSARTPAALQAATLRLAEHLERRPDLELPAVARTLLAGRRAFDHRRVLVCRDTADAAAALRDPRRPLSRSRGVDEPPVVFLFPGQGTQYAGMGAGLYAAEPAFAATVDECAAILEGELGRDLRTVLFPEPAEKAAADRELAETWLTQPALFTVEYALAKLWESWGIRPRTMLGHSIGEYVAATLAGVFPLPEALRLVALRGRRIQDLPPGAMLSVELAEEALLPLLGDGLALAAVNAPELCTVSGPEEAVTALAARLDGENVRHRRLRTSHAFHSPMMEPILESFTAAVAAARPQPPRRPFVSNTTGRTITAAEATDPGYWARHLRQCVRFADGLRALAGPAEQVVLEVGPGKSLRTLARGSQGGALLLGSLRHPREEIPDLAQLLETAGKLWLAGAPLDTAVLAGPGRRAPLPTYPFERERYWIEARRDLVAAVADRPVAAAAVSEAPAAEAAAADHRRPDLLTSYVAPTNAAEETLAGIWQELLGIAQVGVDDDFFELGGHSLLATRVLARVQESFGVELPTDAVFTAPTVAELARRIEAADGRPAGGRPATPAVAIPRRSGDEPVPLSFAQQRLWFIDELAPGNAAYNIPIALWVEGRLDVAALVTALAEVVRRHEPLRTTFAARGGSPVQVVAPHLEPRLPVLDLSALEEERREAEAVRLAVTAAQAPFDLARGPLLRSGLVRLGERHHLLLVTQHHTVSDGWSVGIFCRELAAFYDTFSRRQPASAAGLGELPVRYTDFALWQRQYLTGQGKELLAWWRRRLEGLRVLDLPADRPRPAVRTQRGARRRLTLPPALTRELKALSQDLGATLFMTLLASFMATLHRYTGLTDLQVGSPVAGRRHPGLEPLVGLFVNTLVLRTDLAGDPAFAEAVDRVRTASLEAFAHQDQPFEELVAALRPERDMSRSPLFQVMFVLQNAPMEPIELPELTLRALEVETGTAQFDLTLMVWESEGLVASLEYSRDLFDATTVSRLGEHWRRWVENAVASPGRRLAEIDWASAAERQQLLLEWNDTAAPEEEDALLHELIAAQAARTPEAVAVVFEDHRLSYAELDARAAALGRRLRSRGVGPESRVGICAERSPELMVALLAVLKAGAAYVPLDAEYPAERLAFMTESSGAAVVLAQTKVAGRLPETVRERLLLLEETAEPEAADGAPAGRPRGESLAYVIYTSGSTGRPKGSMISHRAIVNRLLWMQETYGLGAGDVVLQKTPAGFDVSVWEFFWPLLVGARLVLARPGGHRDPRYLGRLIEEQGVTTLHFVPSMLQVFLAEPDLPACSSLRRVILSGEALGTELAERFAGRFGAGLLHNLYGPTEAAVDVTYEPFRSRPGTAPQATVAIGRPIRNVRVDVVDRHSRPVPVLVAGELLIGGVALARGYLGRAGLTAERFVPDPLSRRPGERLYRTGDLVRRLAGGTVEFLGRIDHQVKIRGLRVELGEIEAALTHHPQVREAAVIARLDGDPRLDAYLVTGETASPAEAELRSFLRRSLPEHMVPGAFVFLEALPLTPNGKLDRAALGRKALPAPGKRGGEPAAGVPPRNELEETLAAVWREVLERDEVGVYDNFFDLGGHSLLTVRLVNRLREELGDLPELTVMTLFEHPSIDALVRALRPEGPEGRAPARAETERRRAVTRRKLLTSGTAALSRRPEAGLLDVAVVGMAGRFPGAQDVDELWRNLAAGRESISFFTPEELAAAGVPESLRDDPAYVPARAVLQDAEWFDAELFGVSVREAQLMDPQHRVFTECVWQALEHAAIDPGRFPGRIGLYGGMTPSSYRIYNLMSNVELRTLDPTEILLGTGESFLTTSVSYRLDLRGPSINVATACSTSLVAVHMAAKDLLTYECDAALAGGVSIQFPQRNGYLYRPGGISSSDGHCRAFDARASGTVSGEGAGVVVLKRLADARADGDTVYAVIKGSAVNNDGFGKIGFTAPSAESQAAVIAEAQEMAGVEAETVSYVETHGTGTPLGDSIELRGLAKAFGANGRGSGRRCALGSIKTNLGHLDAAAGVAGLIKTVLALRHRQLPPSLHFEEPNPELESATAPFRVQTELAEWRSELPVRRAGVSSFGIGGTNAHVVLEEAPPEPPAPGREWQLLVLSARTGSALEASARRLAAHLAGHGEQELADVAYTLRTGRRRFAERLAVVCRDREDAAAVLADPASQRHLVRSGGDRTGERSVAFLFPGLGEQYLHMAAGLYESEGEYRRWIDRTAELLVPRLGVDLREVLYPEGTSGKKASAGPDLRRMLGRGGAAGEGSEAERRLEQTALLQPVLFAVEHALARLWTSWGIRPQALLGYSVGEYVAAAVAGVLSADDAAVLVAERARLISELPAGAMLAVPAAPAEAEKLLAGTSLTVAAMNAPELCMVAGPEAEVEALEKRLAEAELTYRRIRTRHAFHSPMMEPAAAPLRDLVRGFELRPPQIPFLSNVTGTWITAGEATDPDYWARHLVQPVRFARAVEELWREPGRILLEVGPGLSLGSLALQQVPERAAPEGRGSAAAGVVLPTLHHAWEEHDDRAFLLTTLGRLWLEGVDADAADAGDGERRRRVALPGYPFERRRFWVEPRQPDLAAPTAAEPATASAAETAEAVTAGSSDALVLSRHPRPNLHSRYVAPRTELEKSLVEIWQKTLTVEPVGLHDDFFDLGGTSLLAVSLTSELRNRFGFDLPLTALLRDGNVEAVARRLRESEPRPGGSSPLVELQPGSDAALPLFCVHPAGGSVLAYQPLIEALGPDFTVYGLEARGLKPGETPRRRVEEMAEDYLRAIRDVRPRGPYALLGWSFGGMVVYEMALRLDEEEVPVLALLDIVSRPPEGFEIAGDSAILVGALETTISITHEELQGLTMEEQYAVAAEKLKQAGIMGEDFSAEDVRRHVEVHKACDEAFLHFEPRPYPGRVLLFRASELRPTDVEMEDHLGWPEVVRGGLEITKVPGTHQTMVTLPNVGVVAETLKPLLRRALAEV